jgi:two-component system, NarL family, invasion response regulator UvrY
MTEKKKTIKIAMVDDHIVMRDALATVVNEIDDCEVMLLADNGKELLGRLQRDNLPDLVILDVNMPEMDGYETAARLRERYPGIYVLILTTFDSDLVTIRMLQAGARGVLVKDCHPSEFRRAITSVMQSGYYYSGSTASKVASIIKSTDPNEASILLTETEMRFLQLASTDITYKEIALKMKISPRTVDSYRDVLFEKLDVKSRIGLMVYAVKHGLTKIQ